MNKSLLNEILSLHLTSFLPIIKWLLTVVVNTCNVSSQEVKVELPQIQGHVEVQVYSELSREILSPPLPRAKQTDIQWSRV
jgi:biopolymer transport protein ExbD